MSESPPDASDEDADAHERESVIALSEAAAGESITAERLREPLISEGTPARLLDVLTPDERPQYLLEGIMIDRLREDGGRGRRMAAPGGSVYTLVTDQAVHLVVQYRDRLDVETVPLERVRGTTVQQVGGDTRLGIDVDDKRYEVYPSVTPAPETRAAAAYLDEWEGSLGERTDDDTLSKLERLAGLYERGLLTDEEFAAAKRDLLDG